MTTEQKTAAIKQVIKDHENNARALKAAGVPNIFNGKTNDALFEVTYRKLIHIFEQKSGEDDAG